MGMRIRLFSLSLSLLFYNLLISFFFARCKRSSLLFFAEFYLPTIWWWRYEHRNLQSETRWFRRDFDVYFKQTGIPLIILIFSFIWKKRLSKNSNYFFRLVSAQNTLFVTLLFFNIYNLSNSERIRKKKRNSQAIQIPETGNMHNEFVCFFHSLLSLFCWIGLYYRAPLPPPHTNVRENLTRTVSEIFFCLWRNGKTIKNKQPAMGSETWAKWMGKYIMMYMCI